MLLLTVGSQARLPGLPLREAPMPALRPTVEADRTAYRPQDPRLGRGPPTVLSAHGSSWISCGSRSLKRALVVFTPSVHTTCGPSRTS